MKIRWSREARSSPRGHGTTQPLEAEKSDSKCQSDGGFTLVELLIVIIIIPIIAITISVALLAALRVQTATSDRLTSSGDTQVVSANFFRDVQSATQITTADTNAPGVFPQCGAAGQVLGLQWLNATGHLTVVSYIVQSAGSFYDLNRSVCSAVPYSSVPTSTSIVSMNVQKGLTATIVCDAADVNCPATKVAAAKGWTGSADVKSVSLLVDESKSSNSVNNPGNSYQYTLAATPRYVTQANTTSTSAGFPPLSPLELLGPAVPLLSGCSSNGAPINVNGAILLTGSGSSQIKSYNNTVINTSVVYYTGNPFTLPSGVVGPPPMTPLKGGYTDPFSNLAPPILANLNPSPAPGQPGVWNTTITGGSLAPGIYYFTGSGAGIDVQGNSSLSGSGVLLYFTKGASVKIGPTSTLNLSPESTGPYSNLVIWQDKADTTGLSWFGNASSSGLTGVVYAPGADVSINGTDNFFATNVLSKSLTCTGGGGGSINFGYTQLPSVAQKITFTPVPTTPAVSGSTFTVAAKGGGSGNPVIFTIDTTSTSSCSISGNVVTMSGPKNSTCVIDANQAGGGATNYLAAIEKQVTVKVS